MAVYEGKVLNGFGELVGWGLELGEDGSVTAITPAGECGVAGEPERWIIPGVIDVHCHGGGGASFPDSWTPEDVQTAIDAHRVKGTTAMLASLVSMIDPLPQIELLVPFCERGDLLGIHCEGPYVSPHKLGAQNPAAQRIPDLDELRSWLEAGKGWIKTMTIAPELENAAEAAALLLEYGAIPSWGHTSATTEEARNRIAATVDYARSINYPRVPQTATHLFNAMPTLAHREPGPVRELIQAARRGEAVVEIIADTVHVDIDLVGDVVNYVQDSGDGLGVMYVTDAMAAAGLEDGAYVLGGAPVTVADGVARLTEGGAIAGGTSRLVDHIKLTHDAGVVCVPASVKAAVAAPAHALGLTNDNPGVTLDFVVGEKPNFVVLNSDLTPETVVREGVLG